MAVYILRQCLFVHLVYPVTGVPPSNIPAAVIAGTSRLDLMKQPFYCGFTYPEIVLLLFVINNIKISLLNRILKSKNLRRRTEYTPEQIVKNYISNEIETSGQCIGYRSMWKRLVNEHRIRVREIKFYL